MRLFEVIVDEIQRFANLRSRKGERNCYHCLLDRVVVLTGGSDGWIRGRHLIQRSSHIYDVVVFTKGASNRCLSLPRHIPGKADPGADISMRWIPYNQPGSRICVCELEKI